MLREGIDFGVSDRLTALGGQQVDLQGVAGRYEEIFLPLHGAHQARNAGYALAAVEAFTGSNELDAELVHTAFAEVSSPGRLEVVRRSPTVVLDAAHNPHGIAAALEAVQDAFTFSPLVGVVGVMADKDVDEIVRLLEPVLAEVVCTQNSTPRAMPAAELGEIAEDVFGAERVTVVRRLDDAIERAIAHRRLQRRLRGRDRQRWRADHRLGRHRRGGPPAVRRRATMRAPKRALCAAMLTLEAVVLALSVPVMISVEDVDTGLAVGLGIGLAVLCVLTAGLLRRPWAYLVGHALQVGAICLGFVVPVMFLVGAMFAGLWALAYLVGRRIEADRARWSAEGSGSDGG